MRIAFTAHAIDRASQRLLDHWTRECADRKPGLYSWLERLAREGMQSAIIPPKDGELKVITRLCCFTGHLSQNRNRAFERGRLFTVVTIVDEAGTKRRGNGARLVRTCSLCGGQDCDCRDLVRVAV